MPDIEIPPELLDAQRAFDVAHAELMANTETVSVERRQELRQAERNAALALQAARERVEDSRWATVAGQQELRAGAWGPV